MSSQIQEFIGIVEFVGSGSKYDNIYTNRAWYENLSKKIVEERKILEQTNILN